MPWSNDKIRIYYNIPQIEGECKATFKNTAKGPIGKKFLTAKEQTQVSFRRTQDSRMQIFQTFDEELDGLKTYTALFHTKAGKDFEKWNSWNFTNPGIWDGNKDANFWYSANTTMLYLTVPYILGKQSV